MLGLALEVLLGILSNWAANHPEQLPKSLQPIAQHPWRPLLIVAGATIVAGAVLYFRERRGGPLTPMQADIQRLQKATDANLEALSGHASLAAPEGHVRLPRTTLSAELAAAAGDLVVTGPPGSGKSALLRDLAVTLRERGEDVVLLTAEALPGRPGPARMELGLEHELAVALTGWTGSSPATLMLDGLDAMRGEEGSGWLRGLVNALESTRWRVVVSIRQFDMHHSPAWQRMLRGAPVSTIPSRRDARLAGVRHLLVGDLTDGELAALAPQSAQLAGLLHEASPRLRELLRNPFNLSLAGDLLIAGQSRASLAQLRSQLELLQRYWQHRVTQGDTGRQRVRVLTSLTTAMIERRRLQVDAAGLFDAAESRTVETLLHDGVLREAPHRLLASGDRHVLFAHHVLFDFAVAALLLGDEEHLTRLVERLDADPSLTVLARPSLDLHLADLWHAESGHAAFWQLAHQLSVPGGHTLAAVAAATTAVQEITGPSDLAPLADTLAGQGQLTEAAHALVGWIASMLAAGDDRAKQQARAALPAYAWLAQRLAEPLVVADDIAYAQTLVRLLWQLEDLAPLHRGDPGAAERAAALAALMQLALADPAAREPLADRTARFLVGAVVVDPDQHGPVLQRTLASEVLDRWGVTALQRYVHDIAVLAAVAPGLAAEVGESLMRFEETRDEATPLLDSGILALTSTRKQDLELTQAELAERLPELLSAAPDVAVRFLAAAVEAPAGQSGSGGPHRYPIRFGTVTGYLHPYGRPLQLLGDHHSAPAMADALATHLRQLAEQPGTAEPAGQPGEDPDQDAVGRLLGLLVARVHHGGVWASLLAAGAAAPHGLGRRLLPLLETSALLAHRATRHAAGSLIRALGPLLTEPEHAVLEDWILAVEASFDLNDPEQAERAAHVRDQLLGCLTLERVQTEQARVRLAELAAAGAPALHEPMHVEDATREFTFADHLAAEGVSDAEIPSSVRNILINLYDDVRDAGDTTDDQRRQAARARLPGEIEAILTLTADEPLTGQLANVVDDLIVRAATMASPVVAPDSPAAPGLIDALLRVAGRASDRGERAVVGWEITPVTEALQALHGLLKDPGWQASRHAPRIRAALRQQLTDPHPVNRMLAAQALQLIEPAGPSRLALARQRLLAEPDAHIRAVLVFQLMSLVAEHAAAVDGLVAELDSSGSWPFASTSPAHGATTADEQSAVENDDDTLANQELVQATVLLVLRLAIQHQQAAAIRIVHRWFTDPVDHADLVHAAVDQLRKLGVLVPDREDSTATGTAFALLSEATGQLATMIEAQRSGQERDDAVLRTALELADTVVDQLYFASGAFGERRTATSGPQEQAGSSSPTGTAFFDLAMPLLDQLAQIHHPRITHRLVETLAHLAEYDPKRVLLTVHRAVPPGEDYTYEPLAVGLIVRLVQRYLAENRELVTTDEDVLTALRELIEVFVRAGWPEAITLAYQLPNAFR